MSLEIYDATLREGEQADGASFSFEDRLELCKRLDEFGVNYIELGWPLASKEIFDSFEKAISFCKNAKIVAFGSTSIKKNIEEDLNLNSIINCGAKYACIFGKTDLDHVELQLKITDEENLEKIRKSVEFLVGNGIKVIYDAEHYFDGFKKDKGYALKTLIKALAGGAQRLILCDTNGGILPGEANEIVQETKEWLIEKGFENILGVHFHNDSELALANTLVCLPHAVQVQGTINGIGERLGNLNFSEFLPIYVKKMGNSIMMDLRKLKEINEEAFRLAGLEVPGKRAFVGDSAFAHKGGVHIDALSKGASYEHANPEDFGNKRVILMNSLGGKASIVNIAKEFGIELDKKDPLTIEKINELFIELKELEKKGYAIGAIKSEQFLLIDKYFGENKNPFKIVGWKIDSSMVDGDEKTCFNIKCDVNGKLIEKYLCNVGGPIEAAYKTLVELLIETYPQIKNLKLIDFHMSIARQKKEESTVRTRIDFENDEEFSCVGVDSNMLGSGMKALEKGFRYYLKKTLNKEIGK